MWSSKRIVRSVGLALAVAAPLALAACSGLTPVYGDHGLTAQQIALAYGDPANRMEQIVYEDLALKLGKSAGGPAPLLTVAIKESDRALTSNLITAPVYQEEAVLTGTIRLVDPSGKVLFAGTRSAAADYTTNAQAFGSQEAELDAQKRAAHALADTIRLTVLGALAR